MVIEPELISMLDEASKFHGHTCPGLAIGVVASKIALESAKRSEDEELVAVVENDACGVDAIQALTGCTYGKGNLIHKDFGKSVYIFFNRNSGKAIRLSIKPDLFTSDNAKDRPKKELIDKVRNGSATEAERAEHDRLRQEHINSILDQGTNIFEVKELDEKPPMKARIFDNIICENCGEPFMSSRLCEKEGKNLCIPCCKVIELKGIL